MVFQQGGPLDVNAGGHDLDLDVSRKLKNNAAWRDFGCANYLAILCDLFGVVKRPFKRLSDLQLGDKKVTLNHLVLDLCWALRVDALTPLTGQKASFRYSLENHLFFNSTYLENKLLLISINFTPKTSHSCLKNGTLCFPGN